MTPPNDLEALQEEMIRNTVLAMIELVRNEEELIGEPTKAHVQKMIEHPVESARAAVRGTKQSIIARMEKYLEYRGRAQ